MTGRGSPTPCSPPPCIRRLAGPAPRVARAARREWSANPEERARHLALSVEGPDVGVAAALEEAASLAGSRGAPQSAAELWEMARRAARRVTTRTWCVGPTRRAWRTTSVVTPRWRGASSSKRSTSRWPGRLGRACCWTWGWVSPRTKGGGGVGRVRGGTERGGGRSRSGHGSSRTSGTPGCSGETSPHRNGTLAQRCSWRRNCRSHG